MCQNFDKKYDDEKNENIKILTKTNDKTVCSKFLSFVFVKILIYNILSLFFCQFYNWQKKIMTKYICQNFSDKNQWQ